MFPCWFLQMQFTSTSFMKIDRTPYPTKNTCILDTSKWQNCRNLKIQIYVSIFSLLLKENSGLLTRHCQKKKKKTNEQLIDYTLAWSMQQSVTG